MINKVVQSIEKALIGVESDMTLMFGGFGLSGIPENTIKALSKKDIFNLTCVSNNAGVDNFGLGLLLKRRQIKKMISSYVGENAEFERQMLSEELEVDLIPQGTLAERCRAGGAGIPAFYTPTGADTIIEKGKDTKFFHGRKYLLEESLGADVAIIKASKGDYFGNLYFKQTSRNFSPLMAMAADLTIVEVEELVAIGDISSDEIHLPGIFVDHIYQGKNYKNHIEHLLES